MLSFAARGDRNEALKGSRLLQHFEASIASAKAWLLIASVQRLIRRVVRT